ncbi:MAG: DUF4230 domain-containing protein [bacterium]|nr:DUF4230 domain-containing protein [bacterium]
MKKYLIIFGTGLLLGIILLLVGRYFLNRTPEQKFGERAAVIRQVQSLNRLETASYSVDKIIEAGTGYNKIKEFLVGDRILLVAHGEVIAGFDLTELTDKSFSGSGEKIKISLPAPKILVTRIDNSKTRVFDRDQGVLTKGDLNLEAEARQQAESAIQTAACEGGILDQATKNAREQLTIIFKSAGFTDVTIETPQIGSCK